MKVPSSQHTSQPWRIHEIASDFTLLDVWVLPAEGTAGDFDDLLELVTRADPANMRSVPARVLWQVRDRMGQWCGLGRISTPVHHTPDPARGSKSADRLTLTKTLPQDLRNSARNLCFTALPFVPLYRTRVEFAAEVSNRTVHGLMHLGWAERSDGTFNGQMAVYVKPRGAFGSFYLRAIEPFRRFVVYPALMRQMGRAWKERAVSRSKVVQ